MGYLGGVCKMGDYSPIVALHKLCSKVPSALDMKTRQLRYLLAPMSYSFFLFPPVTQKKNGAS